MTLSACLPNLRIKFYRRRRAVLLVPSLMAVCYIIFRIHDLRSDVKVGMTRNKAAQVESELPHRPTTEPPISPVQFNIHYNLTIPDNGPIVLITSNRAFLDFAQNWIESVRRLDTHPNILAIAEDIVAYKALMKYRSITTVMTQRFASPEKTLEYLSHEYNVLINKRPVYIYRLLLKGRDVLFSDVDMVWLRDPLPYFEGDFDVVLQEDLNEPPLVVYCAGFVYFRASNASRALVYEWMNRIHRAHNSIPDQKILNQLIAEKFVADLKTKVLDSALFPNGKLYFDVEWRKRQTASPVIVHNNWIEDHEEKVQRFKDHGFWLT